ncbi:RagB/SusD family nutrient uptake outer membrane protein [Pedobacter heparinus]|uniref:RagB/SusD family nutrient uptake outer membrane protein n=1 Tax=Pedobacter heparinus TaxID=984 RepID=UPI00292F4DC4|nr:RagB/SusD family nutrient uptake outer membrane protein [Pedobacter heparinus]
MKRYIIILISLCNLMLLGSCKKYLDQQPQDYLSPEQFYSEKWQVDYALTAMYSNLRSAALCENLIVFANAPTDESYRRDPQANSPTSFTSIPGNGQVSSHWTACYQSINQINIFLKNIDNAGGKLTPDEINAAKGEALFLRGYYYFMLVQWFGGVPVRLTPPQTVEDGQIEKSTAKQVYDQIITDMTEAEGLLQKQTRAGLGHTERVSREAVQGILARVCLHAAGFPVNDVERYKEARAWALKVMTDYPVALGDFSKIFIDEAQNIYNQEVIWELGFIYTGAAANQSMGGPLGNFNGVKMSSEIGQAVAVGSDGVNAIDTGFALGNIMVHARLYQSYKPGDLRRNRTVANYSWPTVSVSASPVPARTYFNDKVVWGRYPGKWRRQEEGSISRRQRGNSDSNFPVLRYSDVLLMFAEAENYVNGPTLAAYNAVNQVRKRAYSTTPILESVTVENGTTTTFAGAVPAVRLVGGGGTGGGILAFVGGTSDPYNPPNKLQIAVFAQGNNYIANPTVTLSRGNWAAGTAYALNDYVTIPDLSTPLGIGRLYRVTTAGTSTATAPANTSGASVAAQTGAVFTYAGEAPRITVNRYIPSATAAELPSGLGPQQFLAAIQNERYLELAFECVRYQDLKRWGIIVPTMRSMLNDVLGSNSSFPGIYANSDVAARQPADNVTEQSVIWPIPTSEITLNKKIIQNPGY